MQKEFLRVTLNIQQTQSNIKVKRKKAESSAIHQSEFMCMYGYIKTTKEMVSLGLEPRTSRV